MARSPVSGATVAELGELASLPLEDLVALARRVTDEVHGKEVLLRGLVELTNRCSMNCLYCGLRRDNPEVERYRLSEDVLTETIRAGVAAGFSSFVLQGGEDPSLAGDGLTRLVESARRAAGEGPALTLSFGVRGRTEYAELVAAGADRYLMRFETADPELHSRLRPGQTLERRLAALEDVRAAGFQLGSGFMVGLPGEGRDSILRNVLLCKDLGLDMGGVGPFIPHPATPLGRADSVDAGLSQGEALERAIRATALLRLALPSCHIPATTAAGSIHPEGRERMLAAGANVLMPNISPLEAKRNYLLYPGKICLDESGFQCVGCLSRRVSSLGLSLSWRRGDALRLEAS